MIGYVTVGTNDLEKAAAFYDALLGELGAKRMMEGERLVAWSAGSFPALAVMHPYDGNSATVGNGVMVALQAPDRATVDKLHAKALELGATDEGGPGPRGGADASLYAGYFRDPDGNKLNAFCMG